MNPNDNMDPIRRAIWTVLLIVAIIAVVSVVVAAAAGLK